MLGNLDQIALIFDAIMNATEVYTGYNSALRQRLPVVIELIDGRSRGLFVGSRT